MAIPGSVIDATRDGSLVLLVGSGLSIAAGMASWDEVATVLREHASVGRDDFEGVFDTLETPDAVRRSIPQATYERILREAYGDQYAPTEQHRIIAQLPFRTILTTNFDSLLERANSGQGASSITIAEDSDVPRWQESAGRQVVKFHGTIERPSTLVFGERSYAELYQSNGLMMSLLRTLFATRPILFVGFGFRDPFVKALLSSVHQVANKPGQRSHFVLVRRDEGRAGYYQDLGLIPVVTDVSDDDPFGTTHFLQELSAAAAMEANGRVNRTNLLLRETERLRNYLGPDRKLRVRAALGPLTVPSDPSLDIFGDAEVAAMEARLRDATVSFVERNGRVDLLCNPVDDLAHAAGKGYSTGAYAARISTFVDYLERFPESLRVAMSERATDANEWIAADRAVVTSAKGPDKDGRLYTYGRVDVEPQVVRQSIRRFDSDFADAFLRSGGNAGFIARAKAAIGRD